MQEKSIRNAYPDYAYTKSAALQFYKYNNSTRH